MKKFFVLLIMVLMMINISACSKVNTSDSNVKSLGNDIIKNSNKEMEVPKSNSGTSTSNSTKKILVAYFSRAGQNYNMGNIQKGNTQIIAEQIADQTSGTLFKIQTKNPYPDDYDKCTEVAKKEKEANARPELANRVENIDDYDVIFLGYPIWWADMPMAVYTFLKSYDFSGKTIIPFCTHEGSGLADTKNSISKACPTANVKDGLAIRGKTAQKSPAEAKDSVVSWIKKINY